MNKLINRSKLGLGGGCHWCTEGVFQSLIGIDEVKQGWISSINENTTFSEGVVVTFDPKIISLKDLIEIHLFTHASTSDHSFRKKYRSAVYVFDKVQKLACEKIIIELQTQFEKKIITQVLLYADFKLNSEDQLNYLYTRRTNSFCKNYIHPKLTLLLQKFSSKVDKTKIDELKKNQADL